MAGARNEIATRRRRGPKFGMTPVRQRVFDEIEAAVKRGEPVPRLAELAQRCGLYSYREARRARQDLVRLGRLVG